MIYYLCLYYKSGLTMSENFRVQMDCDLVNYKLERFKIERLRIKLKKGGNYGTK